MRLNELTNMPKTKRISVTELSSQRAAGWPITSQNKGAQPVFIATTIIQIRISAAAHGGNASRATMSRRLAVLANRSIAHNAGRPRATTAAKATSEPAATKFHQANKAGYARMASTRGVSSTVQYRLTPAAIAA